MDARQEAPGDTLSTAEMYEMMRRDLAHLDAVATAYETTERAWTHTEQRHDLGGENGEGRDEIRRGLLDAQRPKLDEATKAAEGAACAVERNTRRILQQLGEDRLSLPLTEITTASAMAPMIEKDAERLSLPRVAEEMRAAVVKRDLAAMFCWSRAVAGRLATRPEGVERPEDERARSELGRLQLEVKTQMRDTTFDPIRKEADKVLERAWSIRSTASKGRRRLAGPVKTTTGELKVPWPQDAAR